MIMKKKSLFLAALAVLAMATSCSKDEQQAVSENYAISFNPALDVTRGTDINLGNLREFFVTATRQTTQNVEFSDVKFIKDGTSWVSTPKQKWTTDDEMDFYAYTPYLNGITVDKSIIKDFKVEQGVSSQIDLVTGHASGSKQKNGSSGISLPLTHALSKISIQVKGGNKDYTFVVGAAGISNLYNVGTYDIAKNEWSNYHSSLKLYGAKITPSPITVNDKDDIQKITSPDGLKLIPQKMDAWDAKTGINQTGKFAYVWISIRAIKNKDKSVIHDGPAYLPIPAVDWKPNKEYVYTIDLSKGCGYTDKPKPIIEDDDEYIKFVDVTVKDWEAEDVPVSGETIAKK